MSRTISPEVPPHVEYALTDLGKTLKPVIQAPKTWGIGTLILSSETKLVIEIDRE